MDRRRFASVRFTLAALAVLTVLLAGCSVVFEAGISGKVVTASGTGTADVADVSVFAYTDEGLRNSDFEKFEAGTITRPSEGSGYVATTTTNANGEFTVNKIVWETKKSEFGKTADVSKLYLIFYHEDYKPAKTDATVISGSTNASNVYIKLEGSKDYTTLNITISDVATRNALGTACNFEYKVEGKESSDTIIATGAAGIRISYPKDTTPDVTIKLTSPGTGWKMTDKDGKLIDEQIITDVGEGTLDLTLYMKNYSFTIPAFRGSVVFDSAAAEQLTIDGTPVNANDGVQVWLQYKKAGTEEWADFTETKSANNMTYASQIASGNNLYYSHGQFSGVGSTDDYTVTVNSQNYSDAFDWESYTGRTFSLDLRVVFGDESKVREFVYTNNSSTDLGNTDFTPAP